MKNLDQRNKTIRIAFDVVVYFLCVTNFGDFVFKGMFIQINDAFGLGMTSLANTSISIRSVHFLTCCGSFSSFFQPEPDILMFVHIAIPSISFAKSVISASNTKTKFRKSLHRKTAMLHQTLCILPKTIISIIDKAN